MQEDRETRRHGGIQAGSQKGLEAGRAMRLGDREAKRQGGMVAVRQRGSEAGRIREGPVAGRQTAKDGHRGIRDHEKGGRCGGDVGWGEGWKGRNEEREKKRRQDAQGRRRARRRRWIMEASR